MWNITLLWLFYCPVLSWLYFFSQLRPGQTPGWILTIYCLYDAPSPNDVPLGVWMTTHNIKGFNPLQKTQKGGVVRHFHKIVISPNSKWRTDAILPNVEKAITRLSINWFGWNLGGRIPSCPRHVPMMRLPWQRRIVHSAVMGVWKPNAWTNFVEIWYTTAN